MGYRGPVGMEAFASGDADKAVEAFRNSIHGLMEKHWL